MNLMDLIKLDERLTAKQENFCETAGIFGILISLTCLIQQLVFMNSHWLNYCIIAVYILSVVGFAMLVYKSEKAFVIILSATILIFILNILFVLLFTFSLALILLFLYSLTMVIAIKLYGIHEQLKKKAASEKADRDKWSDIVY